MTTTFSAAPVPALLVAIVLCASTVQAWTPAAQIALGEEAASIAPPDLARQIARHPQEFRRGLLRPFAAAAAEAHTKNPGGSGDLDRSILAAVERAVQGIRDHEPFSEVVFRLGVVAHFVADANNPLATSDSDPDEHDYFNDYLHYVDSARPRYPILVYAEGRDIRDQRDLERLVERSLGRGRHLYPLIGREYARIGRIDGRALFDDRSTAFGIGSIASSHAVSDIAAVLRHIWIEAGGGDRRRLQWTRPSSATDPVLHSR